jgi:hypothetical protein
VASSGFTSFLSQDTDDSRVGIIYGPIGAGKTRLACTASEFWPNELPAKKKVVLEDMYWASIDRKALDCLTIMGIDVPQFDFGRLARDPALWKLAGSDKSPSIVRAIEVFMGEVTSYVAAHRPKYVVMDTISVLDTKMICHFTEVTKNHTNQYERYKLNLAAHGLLHMRLMQLGCGVLYLCHSNVVKEDTESQKDKNKAVLVVGGAEIIPELTGQAAKHYKRDASFEFYVEAFRDPTNKKAMKRQVHTEVNEKGAEIKNRFEGVLDRIEEPHLGKILAKIGAAQKKARAL